MKYPSKLLDKLSDGIFLVSSNLNFANTQAQSYFGLKNLPSLQELVDCLNKDFESSTPLTTELFTSPELNIILKRKHSRDSIPLVLSLICYNSSQDIFNSNNVIIIKDVTAQHIVDSQTKDFLSLISHKLRTPNAALGYAMNLLLNRTQLEFSEQEVDDFIQQSYLKSLELSDILEKLIRYATVSADKVVCKQEEFELKKMINEITKKYHNKYGDSRKTYNISCPQNIKILTNFPYEYLSIIIEALIDNGLKFNKSKLPQIIISYTIDSKQKKIAISIKDNGYGIPYELQEKVWEHFYQIDKNGTGEIEGFGLGLALIKKIIDTFSENIEMESYPVKGTIVTFTIPMINEN